MARTSTLLLQDPLASLSRQISSCKEWLPAGWYVAGYFWDVESGAIDLDKRSQGEDWKPFADAGLPRDGGMADLLAEAHSPEPRFAAVVCEEIERSGREMFNALKLERELSDEGIILFATDEPMDVAGVSPNTILVRGVKQGVAVSSYDPAALAARHHLPPELAANLVGINTLTDALVAP